MINLKDFVIEGDTLVAYKGREKHPKIPYLVTKIAEKAFFGNDFIKTLALPISVKSIAPRAFFGCTSLTRIYFPSSLEEIGDEAFKKCSALKYVLYGGSKERWESVTKGKHWHTQAVDFPTSFNYPSSIQNNPEDFEIDDTVLEAYTGSDSHVVVPDGITVIDDWAFDESRSLVAVYLPEGITEIGIKVFAHCPDLTVIYFGGTREQWDNITTGIFWDLGSDDYTVICGYKPNTAEDFVIEDGTLIKYVGDAPTVSIPYGVNKVADGAFKDSDFVTSLIFPDTVDTVTAGSLEGLRNLRIVHTGDGVTEILPNTFSTYAEIEAAVLGKSVHSVENFAFWNCEKLKKVVIPEGVCQLCDGAFSGCTALTWVSLPSTLEQIGEQAFFGCTALERVDFDGGVKLIGWSAFNGCTSLKWIDLPETLHQIGWHAFSGCTRLTEVILHDRLYVIGRGAFENCALTEIDIPESTHTIGENAFMGCKKLKKINIGGSLHTLGKNAFEGCAHPVNITFNGTRFKWSCIIRDLDWKKGAGKYVLRYLKKDED